MRSAIGIASILAALGVGSATAPVALAGEAPPRVRIVLLPNGTDVREMAGIANLSAGVMSAGLGSVPPVQTFLDITQGNRVSQSLYDPEELPPLVPSAPGGAPAKLWEIVEERAESAPAQIVPGLLASTLEGGGIPVTVSPYQGAATLLGANREGRIEVRPAGSCPPAGCPGLTVTAAATLALPRLAGELEGEDMLIAIERPPPERRILTFAIGGAGFGGLATSDSTRTRGLVAATDVAPTILERFGLEVPDEMNGEPIRGEGDDDVAEITALASRLEVTSLRRGPVVGQNVLAWVIVCAAVALAWRRRGARLALPLLALAAVYLPLLCLLTAAIEPSLLAERLIVGLGAPLLAALTWRLAPGWRALGAACLLTVGSYAIDLLLGTGLIELSIPGPNPSAGSRFFGIGNEVEAIVSALLPIGVGAVLAARADTRDGGRAAAVIFLATGAVAAVVFAAGRWGADVGAAITIPAAMAVAAALTIGSRRGIALVLLAPLAGLVALALIDVVAGGGAHLTRSLLEAGGLDQAADVIERRIRLAEQSFERGDNLPYLGIAALLAALFAWRRDRVLGWFRERSALAGFAGAAAAAVVGTVSNDSGAILLILIGAYLALTAGFAWSLTVRENPETGS